MLKDEILNKIQKIKSNKEDCRLEIVKQGSSLSENSLLGSFAEALRNVNSKSKTVYKCLTVDEANKTWTAYKGVFSDLSCVFNEDEIRNLSFEYITPEINGLYNEDATMRYNSINCDQRHNDVYCYYDFSNRPSNLSFYDGSPAVFVESNISGMYEMKTSDFSYCVRNDGIKLNSDNFTVAFWAKNELNEDIEESELLFGCFLNNGNNNDGICVCLSNYGYSRMYVVDDKTPTSYGYTMAYPESDPMFNINYWNHYAFVYDNKTGEMSGYFNGILQEVFYIKDKLENISGFNVKDLTLFLGVAGAGSSMSDLVVSKTAMTKEQIQYLAWVSREVERTIPEITVSQDIEITVNQGEEVSGEFEINSNFTGGEFYRSATVNISTINLPSWMESFPTKYVLGSYDEGFPYFYGIAETAGTFEITVNCSVSEDSLHEIFNGTYYEGMEVESKSFKIKIVVNGNSGGGSSGDQGEFVDPPDDNSSSSSSTSNNDGFLYLFNNYFDGVTYGKFVLWSENQKQWVVSKVDGDPKHFTVTHNIEGNNSGKQNGALYDFTWKWVEEYNNNIVELGKKVYDNIYQPPTK